MEMRMPIAPGGPTQLIFSVDVPKPRPAALMVAKLVAPSGSLTEGRVNSLRMSEIPGATRDSKRTWPCASEVRVCGLS